MIHLILTTPKETPALCSSHFWENPALPEDFPFPCYTDEDEPIAPDDLAHRDFSHVRAIVLSS